MVPHEGDNSMSKAVGKDKSSAGENMSTPRFGKQQAHHAKGPKHLL